MSVLSVAGTLAGIIPLFMANVNVAVGSIAVVGWLAVWIVMIRFKSAKEHAEAITENLEQQNDDLRVDLANAQRKVEEFERRFMTAFESQQYLIKLIPSSTAKPRRMARDHSESHEDVGYDTED
ncbi:MAG: hypothetical protein HQL45_08830 [Alphaproteobacteria bacterium]|nr:hypothetical protein [Alphaproteobacteria bacterium]MBF0354984.1 hypothetical protein [Alphaproteobacteria bacterium]